MHAGCRQWLDLGAGLPTTSSLFHDLATRTSGEHRLVCVDNDPFVLDCIRTYTTHRTQRVRIGVVPADLALPHTVAFQLSRCTLLDLHRPVTVVAGAVLHHLTDAEATGLLATIRRLVTPGSRLLVTDLTSTDPYAYDMSLAAQNYHRFTAPLHLRTQRQLTDLFGHGWTLHSPGITALRLPDAPNLIAGWGLIATAAGTGIPRTPWQTTR